MYNWIYIFVTQGSFLQPACSLESQSATTFSLCVSYSSAHLCFTVAKIRNSKGLIPPLLLSDAFVMQHPLLLVFLTMAHRHVPCSFDKLSLNDTTDRLLRRQSKTRVKRFKSANKNKNIAITGFTHLMKAHKHKQTLDLDLLWIIFLSGKFGLMYVCWRNVTAPYLHWLYHSIPWSQVSPPNHI